MMKRDDWSEIDRLFDQALDQPRIERAAWLEKACGNNQALKAEVERLLRLSDDGAGDALSVVGGPLWAEAIGEGAAGEDHEQPEDRLVIGERLEDYEITEFLGAGGMGTVYRARDHNLGRDVAIKALFKSYAPDAPSLRRFQREARALASLNHPNIGIIYDLLLIDGHPYLVLEFVDGETLMDRIARGPLGREEVLEISAQLVDAMEEAHDKDIVHRDLKPANVKMTEDGRIKVLDFGLAKSTLSGGTPASSGGSQGDNDAALTTQAGTVLGTPSYMSPAQARGESVDERADIWAFGCILYEMLSGKRAFPGSNPSEVVASVLRDDVDWTLLPDWTPPELKRVVRRCLSKAARDRYQHIGDIRIELSELRSGAWENEAQPRASSKASGTVWPIALVVILVVGAVAYFAAPQRERTLRLSNPVQITSDVGREDQPSWSPDGSSLAYAALRGDNWDVWVARADGSDALNRTEDFDSTDFAPSWSPDGSQIAFRSQRDGGGIFAVSPLSGSPTRLVASPDAAALFATPQWSSDGSQLLYTVTNNQNTEGHHVEILTLRTGEVRGLHIPPRWNCLCETAWSPSGRFLAYVDAQDPGAQVNELWLYRLEDGEAFQIADDRSQDWSPAWAADDDSLFFLSNRGGGRDLWRVRLEPDGRPASQPEPITVGVGLERVRFSLDGTRIAYSQGRRISNLYRAPILENRLATWSDVEQLTFDQAFIEFVDVSPDGRNVVVSSDRSGNPDLWLMPSEGGAETQLTHDPTPDWLPAFSPDGTQIAFYAYRSGNRDIWVMPASGGPARQVTTDPGSDASPGWSADGESVLFYSNRRGNVDIWSRPVAPGSDIEAQPLFDSPGVERFPRTSPDGKWIAFTAFGDGQSALWRAPVDGGPPEQVLSGAVAYQAWSRDSQSFYFTPGRGRGNDVWQVPASGGEALRVTDLSGRSGRLARNALAVSEDHIYFLWLQDLGDIWVMDVAWDQ